MWPHQIDALYCWYVTLPATVLLFGSLVAIISARESYNAADEHAKRDVKFKFDETDVVLLSPLLWLFGYVVVRGLSWLVEGFSRDGRIAAFYSFYGIVGFAVVSCLLVLFFFQPSMTAIDVIKKVGRRLTKRLDRFYNVHATRWYFVVPLAMVAAVIIAAEKVGDFAFIYRWYYIGPAVLVVYGLILIQWLGAFDHYADEHARYYLRRAGSLSRWISLLSAVLIVWLTVYYVMGVEGGISHVKESYLSTALYGGLVWALSTLACVWLTTLILSTFYGSQWVTLHKLEKQLQWSDRGEHAKICFRIRRAGGDGATRLLARTLNDPSLNVAARLAAAWELSEMDWSPRTDRERAFMAIGTNQWKDLEAMGPEAKRAVLDVLDRTLYSPRDSFDQRQLSLVTIVAIRTVAKLGGSDVVASLVNAVELDYQPDRDESYVVGLPDDENQNAREVEAVRCEAANARATLGRVAASAVPPLDYLLANDQLLPDAVRAAVESALTTIRSS